MRMKARDVMMKGCLLLSLIACLLMVLFTDEVDRNKSTRKTEQAVPRPDDGTQKQLRSIEEEYKRGNNDISRLLKKLSSWRIQNWYLVRNNAYLLQRHEKEYAKIIDEIRQSREILTELQYKVKFISHHENKLLPSSTTVACVVDLTLFADCGTSLGYSSLILATLDGLAFCEMNQFTPVVVLRGCWAYCGPLNKQTNYWEWYFQPINTNVINTAKDVICYSAVEGSFLNLKVAFGNKSGPVLKSFKENDWETFIKTPKEPLLNLSFRKRYLREYIWAGLIDNDVRKRANFLIKKYLKVQPDIQTYVDNFEREHFMNHNILGVHVRATDHWQETDSQSLPPLKAWLLRAEQIFEKMKEPKRIFVATDNEDTTKAFTEYFGKNKVVFQEAHRADSYKAVEPVFMGGKYKEPRRLGVEVLSDVLLLSRSSRMLHAESNVAALASYFNPDLPLHYMDQGTPDAGVKRPLVNQTVSMKEEEEFGIHEMLTCVPLLTRDGACPNMRNFQFLPLT